MVAAYMLTAMRCGECLWLRRPAVSAASFWVGFLSAGCLRAVEAVRCLVCPAQQCRWSPMHMNMPVGCYKRREQHGRQTVCVAEVAGVL